MGCRDLNSTIWPVPYLHILCPVCTSYLLPLSRQYPYLQLYNQCPVITPSLTPIISRQYWISTAIVESVPHLYSTCPACISYLQSYQGCTPPLQPMSSQYTISTVAHIQSRHNQYCPCSFRYHISSLVPVSPSPVSTPSLLAMSKQNTISPF